MRTSLSAAKPVLALALAALVLTGCGSVRESRLNPFNWFGGSREVATVSAGEVNPLLPANQGGVLQRPDQVYAGVPIDEILELQIDRTRSGAIIVARGLAARQGPYEVRLTPLDEDETPQDGVLSYSFDVIYSASNTDVGPEQTRRVTVARSIGNQTLAETRIVRVVGARNAREVRRR